MKTLEEISGLIRGVNCYLDRFDFLSSSDMTQDRINSLAPYADRIDIRPRREFFSKSTGALWRWLPDKPNRGSIFRLREAGFPALVRHESAGRVLLNGVEIAIDLIADYPDEVGEWIAAHFVDRRLRSNAGGSFEQARYFGKRRRGPHKTFVCYWGRRSKLIDARAVHIELRLQGRAACRRNGLASFDDLRRLDLAEFWRKHLTLFDVDYVRLGRCLSRAGRSKRHIHRHRLRGRLALRSVGGIVADLCDEFRAFRPEKWLIRLDPSALISIESPSIGVISTHLSSTSARPCRAIPESSTPSRSVCHV